MRENLKFRIRKLSDRILLPENTPENSPKIKKCLFAFFNFGIANLERINETTKFKNENFKICNYTFHKMTIFGLSEK